jgi:hypothetical protein
VRVLPGTSAQLSPVQDAIVEALTHVDVSGLQDTIERLLDDKHSEFRLMLESGMWAIIDASF